MRDRIIERHKRGQGYRNISKEMNLALSTVENIIRKYKKYGDGTANLPRNGRPRKINECTSRWISRNVQINTFITRSKIKTDLEGVGINVSKDTINRALYREGFHSRSPRKVPLLKTKHVKDRLNYSEGTQRQMFSEKMALPSRSTIPSPQFSSRVVPLWYGDAFHPRVLVSYKLSMVEWMVACTGRFLRRTFRKEFKRQKQLYFDKNIKLGCSNPEGNVSSLQEILILIFFLPSPETLFFAVLDIRTATTIASQSEEN